MIRLKTKDSQFVSVNLNAIFVVPKHIFSRVADIDKWTNPNPVGSGPFIRVSRFNAQDYVLERNPRYWQKGKPKIACLEYIQATSNDAALLQIVSGQADWTHNFVPNVEKAYIAKNPLLLPRVLRHDRVPDLADVRHGEVPVQPDRRSARRSAWRSTARRCRSSASTATRRRPTRSASRSCSPAWVTDATVKAEAKRARRPTTRPPRSDADVERLHATAATTWSTRGANEVSFTIHVISGWSDWVASLQIITKNLQDIGIDARVKLEPGWGEWFPNATSTKFVTLLWQTAATGSPYGFFFNNMHRNTYLPSGEDAVNTGNFAHFQDTAATRLLDQWKANLNVAGQKKIATQLQKLWLQKLPIDPALHRAAVVDLQHEALPLLPDAARTTTCGRSTTPTPRTRCC